MAARAFGTVCSTSRFHFRIKCGGPTTRTRLKPAMCAAAAASRIGRRRVTPRERSTFPSALLRTGRAAFTASGSPVVYVGVCGLNRP